MSVVEIHYTRPPGRTTVFRQHIVERSDQCIVTLLEHTDIARPVTVEGAVVLERGAPVVWFTFPGAWHDIGRFHTRRGGFTGFYANMLTPVEFVTPVHWRTRDLFLDVWLDEDGAHLLDADELEDAVHAGAVSAADAARAHREAAVLLAAASAGTWPPVICHEWTLERARSVLRSGGTPGGAAV